MKKKAIYAVETCNRHSISKLFEDKRFHMGTSVLEGLEGIAYADDIKTPKFAILFLKNYCFISGEIAVGELQFVISNWRVAEYEIIPTDDIFIKLREIYKQSFICSTRYAFKHTDAFDLQRLSTYIANLSPNYCLKELDDEKAYVIQDSNFMNISNNYSVNGIGVCCMYDNKIIGVASSNIYYKKGIEVNIKVDEAYRKQGIALAMASALVLLCIKEKKKVSWDAANIESLHLADKLGFIYHSSYPVCELISGIKYY